MGKALDPPNSRSRRDGGEQRGPSEFEVQTERQIEIQTERQIDRQIERQIEALIATPALGDLAAGEW